VAVVVPMVMAVLMIMGMAMVAVAQALQRPGGLLLPVEQRLQGGAHHLIAGR
jgi:hypothetical protein